eukprot:134047-Amphidinium_carterae.1
MVCAYQRPTMVVASRRVTRLSHVITKPTGQTSTSKCFWNEQKNGAKKDTELGTKPFPTLLQKFKGHKTCSNIDKLADGRLGTGTEEQPHLHCKAAQTLLLVRWFCDGEFGWSTFPPFDLKHDWLVVFTALLTIYNNFNECAYI